MNYETALALEKAGFPQEGNGSWICEKEGLHPGRESEEDLYLPTLEELIEACGDESFVLGRSFDKCGRAGDWDAQVYDAKTRTIGTGSTPNDAVANLWLALNKP